MKEQLSTLGTTIASRDSHAPCVKIAHSFVQRLCRAGHFRLKHVLGTLYALVLVVTCSVCMCIPAKASTPLPEDLQLVPADSLPAHASWYSVRRWGHYPPSPYNWCHGRDDVLYYRSATFGTNRIIINDSTVDYPLQSTTPGPSYGSGDDTGPWPRYNSNEIWLEIALDPSPGNVDLFLHNPTTNYWQILNKTNLTESKPWGFGEIRYADGSQNPLPYSALPDDSPPIQFFRAVSGTTMISLTSAPYFGNTLEPCTPFDTAAPAILNLSASPPLGYDITVFYTISGTSIPGLDYTNLTGTVVISNLSNQGQIFIQPLYDTNLDFEESVTVTLILTNGYLVDPNEYTATAWIYDCISNLFTAVATNIPSPVGIDFFSPSNSLVLSTNFVTGGGGEPRNFALLSTNATLTAWSGVHGAPDEVKIATVKRTVNGFTNGDMYFGSDHSIGWVSADGTRSNLNWCTLTNPVVTNALYLRGSLYVDQTGTWSNDLIAVTSDSSADNTTLKGVWRIDSQARPTLIANLRTFHLEGVITLTNDPVKWGPWAGKIITGDEDQHVIYAIDTNGVATPYPLGIDPEDFDIIPPNQDLYCIDYNLDESSIVKFPRAALTNYVGDFLVTQAGEFIPPEQSGALFIVHWDGPTTNFITKRISYYRPNGSPGRFEHVTFAPINIPSL